MLYRAEKNRRTMKKETYNFYQYNTAFLKKYAEVFNNKIPPHTNINDYFTAWGYHPFKEPNISMHSNFGAFKCDILLRYKDVFQFFHYEKEGFGYVFSYNLGDHRHLFLHIRNMPIDPETPRFVANPVIYTDKVDKALSIIDANQDLLIKPEPTKLNGFGGFEEIKEIDWITKV